VTRFSDDDELRELLARLREADDLLTPEHIAQRFRELLRSVNPPPTAAEREQALADYRALCDRVDSDPDEQARIDAIVAQITDDDIEDQLRRVLEAAANDDPEDTA
jgi:hypothetical protein